MKKTGLNGYVYEFNVDCRPFDYLRDRYLMGNTI